MTTHQKDRPHLHERAHAPIRTGFDGGPEPPPWRGQVIYASGSNLLAGAWLIAAPFLLGYTGTGNALWNDILIGASIATLAAVRAFGAYRQSWMSWTNATLGGWLVLAPFALNYSGVGNAVGNDVIVGLIVLTLGIWSALASRTGPARR